MNKIKRYIECYIPTETCNLRCNYCYITQRRKFNNKLAKFSKSIDEIRLSLSVKRLGGVCLFNLCAGGETLLSEEVIKVIKGLLEEGHYVMVVTNGTINERFNEISLFPKHLLKRLIFKFSFHYLELVRLGIIDNYFNNIEKMRECGCSFTVELVANDELVPHINEIKKLCYERMGTLCHVSIARNDNTSNIDILTKYSIDEYKKIWQSFNSELFNFKMKIFNKKQDSFCYAGMWSVYLNLDTGVIKQCYCGKELDNIYKDITKEINFEPIGVGCTLPYCYNGHAFLTLGTVPEMETPTYSKVRNRKSDNGYFWLQPEVENFFNQKLKDNN